MSEQRWTNHGAPELERIEVSPTNFLVDIDDIRQMSAIAFYSGGTSIDVTASVEWSSDDEDVATVDAAGLVTGVAVGSTVIRGTLGAGLGAASVIVSAGLDDDEWFFPLAI